MRKCERGQAIVEKESSWKNWDLIRNLFVSRSYEVSDEPHVEQ